MPTTTITRAATAADLDDVRALFVEYVSAPDWEAGFGAYLAQQAFAAELASLPGPYAPPAGALLLARVDGQAAGCVACKPLDPPAVCEMKRLFVRPAFRSLGVARRLVTAVLAAATEAGYARMRLDTLPSMAAAQRLYEAFDFHDIPAYCENPVHGARFMERELTER